jgi:hypothetical protein
MTMPAIMQPQNFCAQIRDAAAMVADKARSVHICHDRLAGYADLLLAQSTGQGMTALDHDTLGAAGTTEETAAYVLALDAINFGSGYFAVAKQKNLGLEYADLALALRRAFDGNILKTPAQWAMVTAAMCHDVFGIPAQADPALDELMILFAKHLNEAGTVVQTHYQGQVENLLADCQKSAVGLAKIVAAWPGFADVSMHDGMHVPIYKRAQILAADMHLALGGQGLADFDDLDQLTIFADNMVPHVLRYDGILTYAPDLAAAIDAGELIAPDTPEEVELRAVSIHAVECLVAVGRAQGLHVSALDLDRIIWNRGYTQDYIAKPAHRTMTVWY